VRLPTGASWRLHWTGEVFAGGREVEVDAPFEKPLFFWRV
jgi:alpha-glucosidase (family GH31 glycosyl hydrolase)